KVMFEHEYTAGNLTVYSSEPLAGSSHAVIDRALEKASSNDIFDPQQKFEVYIVGDASRYALLAPFCRKAFSCLHPLTGKIFLAEADFEKNLAHNPGGTEDPRALENVITHELVKAQEKNKLGALPYIFLDDMKKDGYAEHIVMETAGTELSEMCSKNEKRATLTRFLADRLTLEQVQLETDLNYPTLLKNDTGGETTTERLKQKYCK
ncbi:MAG: hypothetical protein WCK76_15145, partial [Elusimicrobiota bacterium]